MDYPPELSSPDLVGALVQHSDEDQVIGLRIDACLNHGDPTSWSSFLRSSGLVERETLNHVARSGACQFSAVADQLFRSRPVTESFRPDVYLRLLALHCVSHNQNAFQDFMLHAAPVTRRQRQRGGGGVDMEEYARRMTSNRCDGDHITLQALCDALKVNINVVKWTRDDGWYPRTVASATTNDAAAASNPPASVAEEPRRPSRSVFVADTLRPRAVASLDARARDLQLQGRTLWLSLHGEAHFRSLRVRDPVTEAEAAALGRAGDSTGSAGGSGDGGGGGGGHSSSVSSSSSSSSSLSSPPMAGRTSSSSSSSSSCSSSPPPSSSSQGRGGRSSPRLRASSSRSRLPGGCGPGGGDGEASAASAAPAASPKGSATAGDSGSASGPAAPDEACREGRREEQQASSATDGAGSRDVVVAGGTADGSPGGRGPTVPPSEAAEALPDGGGVGDGSGGANGDGSGGANPSSATRGSESPNRDAATARGDNLEGRSASRDGVERVGPDETAVAVTAAGEGTVHSEERVAPLKEGSHTDGAACANNDSNIQGDSGQDDGGEAEDCSICMCPVTGDEDQASLDKCVHAFHFTCIVKWGETTNQCPMCKSRFYVVTRLRDDHVKRFRGSQRRRPLDEGGLFAPNGHLGGLLIPEEPEPEGARAVCLHCQDGGAEEQLMLCDGPGCSNAAHTFCCGLEEVPAGDWFCPACRARREEEARRREADSRRDAILQRVWAVDSGSEGEEEEQEGDDGVEEEVGRGQQQRQPLESSGEEGMVTGAGAAGEGSGGAGGGRTRRAAAEAAAAAAITTAATAGAGDEAIDEGGEVRVSSGDLEAIGLGDSSVSSSSSNEEEEEELHGSDAEGGDAGAGAGPTETRGRTAVGSGVEGSSRPRPHGSASPEARRRFGNGSEDGERLVSVLPGGGGVASGAVAGGASSSGRRRGNRSIGGAVGRSGPSRDGSGSAAAAAAAAAAAPNFWPSVLASATSAMTPRHVFADEEYGEELASSEDEAGPPAGATGVVAQSWADAKLAQQLAQGKNKKNKGKAPSTSKQPPRTATTTRTRPQQQQQPVRGSVSNGQASAGSPVWNGGAASTAASTAALGSTPPSPPPQQRQQQQQQPERRVFKRPRMMRTSLTPVLPPPPPPPLTMSPAKRYGGRTGGGGSVGDGGGVAARGGRRAGAGTTTTTPRLPAASDVRLGHSEVQALVQRLRRVALKERERRSRGWAVGGSSARMGVSEGGGGDPKVPVEVEQTMEELRRVAVHGDATTLDVLLSSQLPTVLRLWLEVAPDGGPFLPPPQRASLLKVLMVLPVQKSHLRESGIGKLVVAMAADPGETRDNRELIKQARIVRRWSQLVFRTPRELPVSPFSPHNHASPMPRRPAAVGTARYAGAGAGAGGAGAGGGWTTAVRSHRARSLGGEMLSATSSSSSSSPPPPALPRHGTFQGTRGTPPPRGKKLAGARNGGSSWSSATLRRGGGARAVVRTIPRRHDVSGGTGGGGVKRTIPRLPPQDGDGARSGGGRGGGAATSSLSSPARHAARHRDHHREPASSSRDSASASLVPPTSSSSSSSSSSTATSSLPHHRQLHLGGNGGGARASRAPSSFSRPASDRDATPRPQQQRQQLYYSPPGHFPARAANAPGGGGGGGGGDGGRKRPREASLGAAAAAASHSRTQNSGRQEGGGAENGRGGGGVSREVGGGGGGGAVGVPSRRFDWPAARGPRSG